MLFSISVSMFLYGKSLLNGAIDSPPQFSSLKQLKNDKFDFIFLDPPYHLGYGSEALELISNMSILDENGIIIYEHLVDTKFDCPNNFEIYDYKKYGTIAVSFIRRKDA